MKNLKKYENYLNELSPEKVDTIKSEEDSYVTIDNVVDRLETIFSGLDTQEKEEINNYFRES